VLQPGVLLVHSLRLGPRAVENDEMRREPCAAPTALTLPAPAGLTGPLVLAPCFPPTLAFRTSPTSLPPLCTLQQCAGKRGNLPGVPSHSLGYGLLWSLYPHSSPCHSTRICALSRSVLASEGSSLDSREGYSSAVPGGTWSRIRNRPLPSGSPRPRSRP